MKRFIFFLVCTMFFQTAALMAQESSQTTTQQAMMKKETPDSAKLSPRPTATVLPARVPSATIEVKTTAPTATVDLSKATTEVTNKVVTSAQIPAPPKKFVSHGENSEERLLEVLQKKVKQAIAEKDYESAKNLYQKYAQKPSWSAQNKAKILKGLREMTYLSLFSEGQSDLTSSYKIKKGDNLHVIAKKNNTTVEMIQKLNQLTGDVIFPDQELKLLKNPLKVLVDKSENRLYLFVGEAPLKEYVVSTGKDGNTPEGDFKIVNKLKNPTWYKTGAVIPAESPKNELGTRWLGFDKKGYGIHGTIAPEELGKAVSAGCVRMKNEDVEELYSFLPHQALVKVIA